MCTRQRTEASLDVRIVLAFAALALLHCWPVVASGGRWGFWDWDVFQTLFEAGRVTVLEYGQLPGWTPWVHGGEPLDSHPLHPIASPAFLAVLLLGTVPALKVWVVLRAFAALFGGYLLGRRLGLSHLGSVTVALVFGLASTYALRVGHGHWNLQSVAYLPLLAHATLGSVAERAWRDRILASVWLALMFLEGGPYGYAMGALTVLAMGLPLLVRNGWGVIPVLACVGAFSLSLSAVKLVPTLGAYGGGQREEAYGVPGAKGDFYRGGSRTASEILWQALLERDQKGHREKKVMPYYINVGAYIGGLGLAFVALGAVLGGWVGRLSLLLALPFIWLVLGNAAPINLWALLHALPGWSSMTVPSKFTACYLLAFAVAAGAGIDGLEQRLGRASRWRLALAGMVGVMALDLLWVSRPIFAYAFPVEPIATQAGPFRQVESSPYREQVQLRDAQHRSLPRRPWPFRRAHTLTADLPCVRSNIGVLGTYTGQLYDVNPRPDVGESLGLEQLPPGNREPPRLLYWSPNELRIGVDPGRGGELVVNHNFGTAWTATAEGRPLTVRAHAGLLSTLLEPGVSEVVFRYRSAAVRIGAAVSALSLAFLVLGVLRLVLSRHPEDDTPPA